MTKSTEIVPIWTLATETGKLPDLFGSSELTPERLTELRTVLAAMATTPIATLEVRPGRTGRDTKGALALHSASPLARQLSELVSQTLKTSSGPGMAAVDAATSGEVLYRMVVPAKVAAQMGKGLVKPMASKTVTNGIYGGLRDSAGIVANAAFVPVAGKAATAGAGAAAAGAGAGAAAAGAGGVAGSAAAVGGTVATASAITVAAPLVLMAVAVGVSAYAEHQRQQSIERITTLLEDLHEAHLEAERLALSGCRDAIDKATSVLLDKGRLGMSLGLDSASYAISTAIDTAESRVKKWKLSLDGFGAGPVDLSTLTKAFPGLTDEGGLFRAHMEMARLAVTLKRRVLILQAVEHAKMVDDSNPFTNFIGALQDDERRVDSLERDLKTVLVDLSRLEVKRNAGLRAPVFTAGEVDKLLHSAHRLRLLGEEATLGERTGDVAIDIERNSDGSLLVYPAEAQ